MLIAVAAGREVGIDVERIRDIPDRNDIVLRCSSPIERAAWKRLPSECRRGAFLCWWSRKEAVIKAIGRGLSFPLDAFDVELDPRRSPRLLGSRDRTLDHAAWSMHAIELQSGYVSTLTVQGPPVSTRMLKFLPCSLGVSRWNRLECEQDRANSYQSR